MKTLGLLLTSFVTGYQLINVGTVAAQDDLTGSFKIRKPIDSTITFGEDVPMFGGDVADNGDKIFNVVDVDELPEFPGGQRAFARYLSRVKYPIEAIENDIEGTISVDFVIDEHGYIHSQYPQLIIGPDDPFLRRAALEWIKNMPQPWKPGRLNGTPVKVSYVVPIKFSLN
jgi:TonB family protein